MTYLGKGRVCTGEQGYGETSQIDYKMNFIQVNFTNFFWKSDASHK